MTSDQQADGTPLEAARRIFDRRLARSYQQAIRARAIAEERADLAGSAAAKLAEIERQLVEATTDTELPMARLGRRLGLQPAQLDFLWTAVTCSVDGRIVPHLEALGGGHARRGLSPSVYAMLVQLDDESVAALAHWLGSPNPLIDLALITTAEPASPAARAYLASSRLVGFLAGREHRLDPLHIARAPTGLLHDRQQASTIMEIGDAFRRGAGTVVLIEGPSGSGRVTAAACALGGDVVVLDAGRIATGQLADALTALRREAVLRPTTPVLANVDHVLGEERAEARRMVADFIDCIDGPLVVTATVPGTDLGTRKPLVRLPWCAAETETRAALWARSIDAAGAAVEGSIATLAHRYRVGPAAIDRAVTSAHLRGPEGTALDEARLVAGLRHNIAERLGGLANRVEVTQSWDDLVIAEDAADQIAGLVGRIRHGHQVLEQWGYRRKIARGAGVAALLSGPPGTGKTMVAGLVARELDLELYQVDLSKVVSKWIGESEKALARVFDAAEEGHALLLFDEADSLFGRRSTDIKGAVDRYANMEVNYLLQRVEAFGGITILTTNLETAIDPALKRRLAAHIVFAAPDEDERARLWQRQTTTGDAPLGGDVDHEALARAFPNMSGANIRNAAIAAAFLAAAAGAVRITHEHLNRAARAEYRSMGYMVSETMTPDRPGRRSY